MTELLNDRAITFAQISKLIVSDIDNSIAKSSLMKKYTKEQIVTFLEAPHKSQKELRNLSNYLYNVSSNYKRLILYFGNMLRFDYTVEPFDLNFEKVDNEKFTKEYFKTLKILELMNLPHEMIKVMKTGFKEDVFYGYEHTTADAYFIQKLNPDYCRISSIEDGVFNFEFDFSYFKNKEAANKYPDEFVQKYQYYLNDKQNKRWQELDSKSTICIKVNDDLDFPLPLSTEFLKQFLI